MKTLQSKKLLAYLVAELTWKVLLGLALWRDPSEGAFPRWTLITMVIVMGFLEVGYILGQAYVDQFIHATRLRTNNKEKEEGDD